MKSPSIGSVNYFPNRAPPNPEQLGPWLDAELQRIQAAISALALGHIDMATVAPTKPREGDIRLANGTTWAPGAAAGVYAYYSGSWHFLG